MSLAALWMPTLVSAVFVFIAANLLWMGLPFWHRRDYDKLTDEAGVLAALRSSRSGMYIVPSVDWKKQTPEQRTAMQQGPMAMLLMRNPVSQFSFPAALVSFFVYTLLISVFVAYLAAHTLAPAADFRTVFRIAGTAGMLGYAFGGIPYSIWYGKPWSVALKEIIDGVIYGLIIGATFGWLWPH